MVIAFVATFVAGFFGGAVFGVWWVKSSLSRLVKAAGDRKQRRDS